MRANARLTLALPPSPYGAIRPPPALSYYIPTVTTQKKPSAPSPLCLITLIVVFIMLIPPYFHNMRQSREHLPRYNQDNSCSPGLRLKDGHEKRAVEILTTLCGVINAKVLLELWLQIFDPRTLLWTSFQILYNFFWRFSQLPCLHLLVVVFHR